MGVQADDQAGPTSGLDIATAMSRVGAAFVGELNQALAPYGIDDFAARSAITLSTPRKHCAQASSARRWDSAAAARPTCSIGCMRRASWIVAMTIRTIDALSPSV